MSIWASRRRAAVEYGPEDWWDEELRPGPWSSAWIGLFTEDIVSSCAPRVYYAGAKDNWTKLSNSREQGRFWSLWRIDGSAKTTVILIRANVRLLPEVCRVPGSGNLPDWASDAAARTNAMFCEALVHLAWVNEPQAFPILSMEAARFQQSCQNQVKSGF